MITPLDDEFYVDPLWESFSSNVSRPQRLGTDPTTGMQQWGRRGPRITLSCTRECGATPSRHKVDIATAARLCLERGWTEFQLPS